MSLSLPATRPTARGIPAPDPVGLAGPVAVLLIVLTVVSPVVAGIAAAGLVAVNVALWVTAPSPGAWRDCASPARPFRS